MKPTLEILEDRCVPAATLGSTVLSQIEVGNVPDMSALGRVLVGDYAAALAPWGVSASNSSTTSRVNGGAMSDAQAQALIASQIQSGAAAPVGPHSFYLVYLPQPVTDNWAQGWGGYHSSFTLGGQQVAYGVVWSEAANWPMSGWDYVASHEFAEASVDPFGGNPEICDPVAWQTIQVDGYPLAQFILPNGQPPQPPQPPQQPPNLFDWLGNFQINIPDFSGIIRTIEQDIAGLVSLWQSWESQVLSWETSLLSGLPSELRGGF